MESTFSSLIEHNFIKQNLQSATPLDFGQATDLIAQDFPNPNTSELALLDTAEGFDFAMPLAKESLHSTTPEAWSTAVVETTIPSIGMSEVSIVQGKDALTGTIMPHSPLSKADNFTPVYESGVFAVDASGQVMTDFLLDGGSYEGDLALFSLTGMETLKPGSTEFIQEAARRALTNSTQGHVIIADAAENARFGELPAEITSDPTSYSGSKTFAMNPGDRFGFMLVPDGTIQELYTYPNRRGAKQPIFSMATSDPDDVLNGQQFADLTGQGQAFAWEDLPLSRGDRDYNDIVLHLQGATGTALSIDEVIEPTEDWRQTEIGQQVLRYLNPVSSDFTGDGQDDIVIRSAEWAGLLTHNGAQFQLNSIQHDWIDGWNLGYIDQHFVGDFDGDGRQNVFIRSPEWAGLLSHDGLAFHLKSIQHDWIDAWNLSANDGHFIGDFNGDGQEDVFIRNAEWAGLLSYDGTSFRLAALQHDWIDDWNLSSSDQHVVGDFNGDGQDDIFIRSPEWVGLLNFDGTAFRLTSLQYDWIDSWDLSPVDQQFVGDFNGDGQDDIFIRSPEWVGLLNFDGTAFRLASAQYDWVGGWNLAPIDQHFIGDFNGDRQDDIFIRSAEWAGLLSFDGFGFQQLSLQYDWIDGWNLGGLDQHFVGDFNGDFQDDIFIRSAEWAGLLSFDGWGFRQLSLQHDWIDGWNLGGLDQHFVKDQTQDLRPKALWADTAGAYGEYGVIPAVYDVEATFSRASGSRKKRHKFSFNPNDWSLNGDKPDQQHLKDHIQSVARLAGEGNDNLLALSRSARDIDDDALYVARFDGIQSDGDAWKWAPYRTADRASDYFYYRLPGANHAGGIQALGSMVFVAADCDDGNSCPAFVQVMDLRNLAAHNPNRLTNRLEINGSRGELDFTISNIKGYPLEDYPAGSAPISGLPWVTTEPTPVTSRAAAVSAVRLQGGNHLLFVRRGTGEEESGWFFVSDSPDIDTANWHFLDFWTEGDLSNGTPWEEWETINFIPEAETGDIYMVAMGTTDNRSFLYRLTETIQPITGHRDFTFEYVDGRGLNTSGPFVSTRYGAGVHVTPNRSLVSYVTDRQPNPRLRIQEFRYHHP